MPTWLLRFDEDGTCVSPVTADRLIETLRPGNYSDVLFHSHGWNTDFAEAVDQYRRFLAAFAAVSGRFPLSGFRPFFVGVIWPSVWIAEDTGPVIAALPADPRRAEFALVERLGAGLDPTAQQRFYALADADVLNRAAAIELAGLLMPQVGAVYEEADDTVGSPPIPEEIVNAAAILADMRSSDAARLAGKDAVLGVDGLPVARVMGTVADIDPRDILRLFSLFQMKDRAGRVGANGVAALLRRVLAVAGPRVHVLGHSFGAKVVLSALAAPAPLLRKADSLLLLQPAISHLAFAETVPGRPGPGGYRAALDRVAGRVFSTFSRMDRPLHDVFHLALRRDADLGEARIAAAGEPPSRYAALGGYGPRASGEHLVSPIRAPGEGYDDIGEHRLVGLDGSDHRITSHGDVANPYTAWALSSLIGQSMV